MEELRNTIWDYLYQKGQPQSLDTVMASVSRGREEVLTAIDHEWFLVDSDEIGIAYTAQTE